MTRIGGNIMKKSVFIFSAFLFTILACTQLFAQEEQKMTPEQEAWIKYMTPGEMHKMMAKGVGEWKTKAPTNESFQAGRFQEGARIRASLFWQTALSPKKGSQSGLKNEQFSLTSPHWMKQIHRPESNII